MLKQLKMDLKLYKDNFVLPLALVLVGFCLGFGLLSLVMFLEPDPGSWFPMGTMMAWGMLLLFSVIINFAWYYQQFMMALSMGRSRKEFLFSFAVRLLLNLTLGYGLLMVLGRIELALGEKLFAPWPLDGDVSGLMDWRFIAILLPVTVILSMFIGSLYSYFGKKALAPLWFAWMAVCLGGPRLSHEGYEWVWKLLPGAAWAGLGIGVVGAMIATILILGKKQMVK